MFEQEGSYSQTVAYPQSKLANILFSSELARRLQGTCVVVWVVAGMYTGVSSWVCTCGSMGCGCVGGGCVGGGWDVHQCEVVVVWVVVVWVVVWVCTCVSLWVCTCGGVGGGLGVHMCEVMGVYMWWCGWWLGCTHV